MTESQTTLAAEPQLLVRDVAKSCAFYAEMLGFSLAFCHGAPPHYAQVFRDGARLNLGRVDGPVIDPAVRDHEQLLSATVTLDDAEPLFLEYQATGVDFAQTLRHETWGARTFIDRDPEGNLLLFAGRGK